MLFWSQAQRTRGLRNIDRIYSVRSVAAGDVPRDLADGAPLDFGFDIDAHMQRQCNAGLIILHDGRVRFERYRDGYGPDDRWTSFSVAKSITSTLVGAAIRDGAIGGIDDRVAVYLPGLAGSAYDDVTLRHLLTMTSGVKWNEAYDDPAADVAQFWAQTPEPDVDNVTAFMRKLAKAVPAGCVWLYNTGETNLLGAAIASATGRPLATYLSEKIWRPYGMARDAAWIVAADGREVGGCCLSVTLRDYARFGQFILDGATIAGEAIVPDGWLRAATTKQADIGEPGRGYGYQWWTNDDGSFDARGIFGQGIFIDPATRLVIASSGNWPNAVEPETLGPERQQFYRDVRRLVA
jgi:CubicO group peptidase (beta-lactamase class C family)